MAGAQEGPRKRGTHRSEADDRDRLLSAVHAMRLESHINVKVKASDGDPARRSSGYRRYAESDVTTVLHVRSLLAAGLSTATIVELLPCMGADGARLVADCPELLIDLCHERDRLTASIGELDTARRALDAVIATASPETEHAAAELLRGRTATQCEPAAQ